MPERREAILERWREALEAARRLANPLLENGLTAEQFELLRASIIPQLEAAVADVERGGDPAFIRRANAFVPDALSTLGAEDELEPVREAFAEGLALLGP